MPEQDWMLEENCDEGIRQDGLRQKAQRIKYTEFRDALVSTPEPPYTPVLSSNKEDMWCGHNYAHEHAFSADLNKARRER